jgi:thiol-disulfide isomerase/thioredoxin
MVLLESQVKLKAGDNAPDFELVGIDDKKHNLDDYKKYQGILIIFMCNHCPYVKAKFDAFNELYEKFGDKIAIIGINSNDSTDYPEDYGGMCTPDPYLFNKDGKLVFHGRIDNAMKPDDTATEKTMSINIEKMLSNEKIEPDFDPSIGCSIKWKEN